MIDVQVIAGRRPELILESITRILLFDEIINHVYVANNTGNTISILFDKVTVVENEIPLTFEQNHNRLALLGNSDYILFLDDDAFVFPDSVKLMLEKLLSDRDLLLVGGVNNQTWDQADMKMVPKVSSLEYFLENEGMLANISSTQLEKYGSQEESKLFCPGNLMLTRRSIWQDQYGGWDECYKNWNEEIDYILWGYERGLKTIVLPGVWFFHGMSSSRRKDQLLLNIVESSKHFICKFPESRQNIIAQKMESRLAKQMDMFIEYNKKCQSSEFVIDSSYYKKIIPILSRDAETNSMIYHCSMS